MNSIPSSRDASNGPDVKTKFLSLSVDAKVETPSRTYTVPCFFYEPFTRDASGIASAGAPSWRLRILPLENGVHRITIHTKEKSGRAVSPVLAVTVGARNWPGMLHVSAKNPLALEFDKTGAAPLMGFNVFGDMHKRGKPLTPDRIDRDRMRIERLATAGGNFIRLRADSWWYALDNPPDEAAGYSGMGRINLRSAWDIDQLVSLCEAKNIQVMFCFENANAHVNEPNIPWRKEFNTYEKSRGGTVEAMADFWTDPASKKTFLRKLRYAVARWGASPSLAMWEFFNEVEIMSAPVAAWHGEMANYLKSNDPHQRMVTTSGTARKQSEHDDALWKHAAIDVVQYHCYRYENTADFFSFCRNYIAQYGKPFIAGEFATKYVQENAIVRFDYRKDRNAMMPHLGHWGSAMAGSAVVALDWHVAQYESNAQFYANFTHLRAFLADVPYGDPELKSVVPKTFSVATHLEQPTDVRLSPRTVMDSKSPHTEFTLREDGTLDPPLDSFNGYIWGSKKAHLRNPPVFIVNYPHAGRFVMRVVEVVGVKSNPVQITLNGAVALEEDLVCELGRGKKSEKRMDENVAVVYDRDLAIDIPAGEHRIGVDNMGTDRFSAMFTFEKYASVARGDVMASALVHSGGAHLWLANRTWSPETIMGILEAKPANGVTVTLEGLRNANATVGWIDPMSGKTLRIETVSITGGKTILNAGNVPHDIACRLKYL